MGAQMAQQGSQMPQGGVSQSAMQRPPQNEMVSPMNTQGPPNGQMGGPAAFGGRFQSDAAQPGGGQLVRVQAPTGEVAMLSAEQARAAVQRGARVMN